VRKKSLKMKEKVDGNLNEDDDHHCDADDDGGGHVAADEWVV
jgi:hypothetical protein